MSQLKSAQLVVGITRNRIQELQKNSKPGDPAVKEGICDILVDEAEKLKALGYRVGINGELEKLLPPGHPDNTLQRNAQVMLARMQQHILAEPPRVV